MMGQLALLLKRDKETDFTTFPLRLQTRLPVAQTEPIIPVDLIKYRTVLIIEFWVFWLFAFLLFEKLTDQGTTNERPAQAREVRIGTSCKTGDELLPHDRNV